MAGVYQVTRIQAAIQPPAPGHEPEDPIGHDIDLPMPPPATTPPDEPAHVPDPLPDGTAPEVLPDIAPRESPLELEPPAGPHLLIRHSIYAYLRPDVATMR